jgi:hypothetical protein
MQSPRHWNDKQMVNTHAQAHVWTGRCYSVVASCSTHREVTANRPDIIIKNIKKNMHIDRWGNTCRQKFCAEGSGNEAKIQEFTYQDTMNVEPET